MRADHPASPQEAERGSVNSTRDLERVTIYSMAFTTPAHAPHTATRQDSSWRHAKPGKRLALQQLFAVLSLGCFYWPASC